MYMAASKRQKDRFVTIGLLSYQMNYTIKRNSLKKGTYINLFYNINIFCPENILNGAIVPSPNATAISAFSNGFKYNPCTGRNTVHNINFAAVTFKNI